MEPVMHVITVTDKDGTITVDRDDLKVYVKDSVTWVLSPDSTVTELSIAFNEDGFRKMHYALYQNGGFGIIANTRGTYNYTISDPDGRRIDPIIIVCTIPQSESAEA